MCEKFSEKTLLDAYLQYNKASLFPLNQLYIYLLFKVLADDLELAVVLKYLSGDIQAQVGGIDNAAHELKVVVDELVAVFLNEHAVAVELDALLGRAAHLVVDVLASANSPSCSWMCARNMK